MEYGRGPYLAPGDGAKYCGYRSVKYFRRKLKEKNVPEKTGGRVSVRDLDLFMDDENHFLQAKNKQPRRRVNRAKGEFLQVMAG